MAEAGAGALLGTATAADYVGGSSAPGANNAPLTPETAAARLEAIKADPKWVASFNAGDIKARDEHFELVRLLHGGADQQTRDATQAREQREKFVWQQRAVVDVSDDVARQIIEDSPVSAAEREKVEQLWQRLSADFQWRKAWLSGDRAARNTKFLIDTVLARPTIQESPR